MGRTRLLRIACLAAVLMLLPIEVAKACSCVGPGDLARRFRLMPSQVTYTLDAIK